MRRSPQILIALLLLLPLASWTITTGGLPLCCWASSSRACPLARGARGPASVNPAPRCPMPGMAEGMGKAGSADCGMSSAPQLTLPAPLVPVVLLPVAPTGIPVIAPLAVSEAAPTPAPSAGFLARPFHPPSLG